VEALALPGGDRAPLVVLGGVETGMRPLAGTERVLQRRWERRTHARPVTVLGRPLPDDPADAERMMHPRVIADGVARVLRERGIGPVAIEAESGGGRISLWLTVDRPELISRLILASVASETPPDSPMAERMARWISLAEAGDWGTFFASMAQQMKAAAEGEAGSFAAAARLQPRPATPERFIGELKATLDPSSFVTSRLAEIDVPTLVLAGEQDQVVPLASTRLVADGIPGARLVTDPESGHTVRVSFRGYDGLVEAFLDEGVHDALEEAPRVRVEGAPLVRVVVGAVRGLELVDAAPVAQEPDEPILVGQRPRLDLESVRGAQRWHLSSPRFEERLPRVRPHAVVPQLRRHPESTSTLTGIARRTASETGQ
jgi:pimeloyl-ACP methyl ester carboxylesterase